MNREAIAAKIRKLLARTEAAGATEAEAMAAAKKAAELMRQYRLTMSDVEFAEEEMVQKQYPTGRKTCSSPILYALEGIEAFCGVLAWTNPVTCVWGGGTEVYVGLVGMTADIELAWWLLGYIEEAAGRACKACQLASADKFLVRSKKRQHTRSFKIGFCLQCGERLVAMAKEQEPTLKTANGHALVPLRNALLTEEALKRGLKQCSARMKVGDGFHAGQDAGQKAALNRPLENAGADHRKLIGGAV